MAGNIIPAIATANAIVAGLAVLRAQAVLKEEIENCTSVYLRPKVNHRGQLFVPERSKLVFNLVLLRILVIKCVRKARVLFVKIHILNT